ncbi:GMC family oxidoreductase [Methylocapsa sp. S129]|uniref:GMC family oxidoreductase n=1 Tax=Methylocapsa sp. S129 TaxID=1641869 RepID=UPI00131BE1E5|nr:GMC family oxidoreductase N-terminal domain-containing protein [Methylocapsa sp. S129]
MAGYDYIVVGAGSAGCVIAAGLSESGDARVLLLEAGGPDSNPDIHIPAHAWRLWMTEDDWRLPTAPQAGAAGRALYLPRGKVLGGSSSINGMIYIRGNRADYDHWAYLGNAGWDYESVLPYFKKSEDYWGGAGRYHGADGSLSVSRIEAPNPLTEAFLDAGRALGIERNDDFAGESALGIGLCDLTVRDGQRCSAAAAFLRPAMNRGNLTVLTQAHVRRLVIEGNRCMGVEYWHEGAVRRAEASGETILSAGAFGSPKLLMLSGVGDAGHLKTLGVPIVQNLPGVGRNLQDHFLTFVIHEAKKPVPPPRHNILEAHLFAKTDSRLIGPDHQPLFMNMAPPLPYLDIPPNAYAIAPGIIRPISRGEMRLTSADPDAVLHIDPGYLREEADVNALVHSLEVSREILNNAAFAEWRKAEVWPRKSDRQSLQAYVREVSETYHHHAGTCRMGVDAASVVDPQLRVHGVTSLRIADASIMPDVVSGNTNAPSIMIGEKASDLIRASAR